MVASLHTHTQFYQDRAIQRNVIDILVKCDYHTIGCPWIGQLKNWEVREGGREGVREGGREGKKRERGRGLKVNMLPICFCF